MQKVLLTIAYDGTSYSGWQRQKNAPSIQQTIEEALQRLLRHPIKLRASSRTDSGVHALRQKAAFVSDTKIPLDRLPSVASGFLPADIAIHDAIYVADSFCPRFDAIWKTYSYKLHNSDVQNPLLSRFSAHVRSRLDTKKMTAAAAHFVGTHDFRAFCATGGSQKTYTRRIISCDVQASSQCEVVLTITGSGFLYNMVRIIAGTLVYVGHGKIQPCEIPGIIESGERTRAGKTMPPNGLVLVDVGYDDTYTDTPAQANQGRQRKIIRQ